MLGRVKSAIFIDYENVAHRTLPDTIPNWVAWLERGEFDEKRRRRKFVDKRVYWNSSSDHLRGRFSLHGFRPILCERFAGLKNAADIKMAIDVIETTLTNPKIKEFILVTRDSDFVPVLQRLREGKRLTAILVDPNNPARFTTYRTHADIVISHRDFLEATTYKPTSRRKLVQSGVARVGRLFVAPLFWTAARVRTLKQRGAKKHVTKRGPAEVAARQSPVGEDTKLDLAVTHVNRIASLKPNLATSRA
ncbi:MAG: NYN domain-containing protein, partial [Hyphomicrobiaceae bacterium]